ncbi:beta-ketoacyl synthase [Streptomyces antioxidans]|uniref:Beta-ketoacyl synthase n=1 Tax=Streptomyces antioxidans TaxID=1507734 RepID=A0A1V4CYK8_9ACTN|nr:beta-ketoacyl synthase N-terminal-like domain-containing protein [Streptomyces antioxidans]OPF73786.1 beta-ketoacyl synthase [Streptomyces antioxidans]
MTSASDTVVTGVGLALPGARDAADLLRTTREPAEPVDPGTLLGRRGLRYKDRATQLALCAARDVLRSSGLLPADGEGGLTVPGDTVGVAVSSNLGNLDTVCEVASAIGTETTSHISPMALPNASSNVIASSVAMQHGLRGPNLMFCNGPTSGLDAVYWAATLVAAGRCDRAVVIGVETANPVVEGLLGEAAERLLDGAVALVIEGEAAARARGVRPLAALGAYTRRESVRAAVERVLPEGRPAPGIWLTSQEKPPAPGTPGFPDAPRHDPTGAFGRADGALGVLQCAAAVARFGSHPTGTALITTGEDTDDAVAGLLLHPAREEHP